MYVRSKSRDRVKSIFCAALGVDVDCKSAAEDVADIAEASTDFPAWRKPTTALLRDAGRCRYCFA